MKASGVFHGISNFLFSRTNRAFLIFLFFFAVAGIFWLMMSLNETYEQEVRIPVRYTNIAKNAVLTSPETDTIRATISDKGYVLLTYLYGDALHPIDIDFKTYSHANGSGSISASELSKMVSRQLAASSKLVNVKPEKLSFYYNYGEKKVVPVRWRGNVTPEALYYLAGVTYNPDSVTIYASRAKLDSIHEVYTESLHYSDFHDTLTINAQLAKLPGVKIVPQQVRISFITDVLTEESINDVPIVGINLPPGKVLRAFPAKVTVKFVSGVKTLRSLSPSDFLVVADYNEIIKNPSQTCCPISLQKVPEGVSRVTLIPTQVDYLLEEQAAP